MVQKLKSKWFIPWAALSLAAGCKSPSTITESDWCNHVQPGVGGQGDVLGQFSQAHARIRFFGAFSDPTVSDQALAQAFTANPPALAGEDPSTVSGNLAAVLSRYQGAMPSTCVLDAQSATPLPAASVELKGTVAVIHPGTGAVKLPSSTQAVAVDLRNLPNVTGLSDALSAAFSQAISGHVTLPTRSLRESVGLTDEGYGGSAPYSNVVEFFPSPDFEGAASRKWPVAVLTSTRMSPQAAFWAIGLRQQRKAWLYGERVDTAVAESTWSAVGSKGIAYRASDLGAGTTRLPDYVPADVDSKGLDGAVKILNNAGTPAALETGLPNSRTQLSSYAPSSISYSTTFGPGEARAMLFLAHGTSQLFFPFFQAVGNTLDAALRTQLATLESMPAESLSRALMVQVLQQFGVALKDAGNNAVDTTVTLAGVLPVSLDALDAGVVVQRSAVTGINAGDTLTAWNNQPMADVLAAQLARTSASTDAARVQKALGQLTLLSGPVHLSLSTPGGAPHELDVQPQTAGSLSQAAFPSRASGFLTDHPGAQTVYYLNLDSTQTTTANFSNELKEAATASAVIVDVRGTLGVPVEELVPPFFLAQFNGPLEYVNQWEGPSLLTRVTNANAISPSSPAITTKVALLVSANTLAESERFATTLADANRATLVGRPTGGTVGQVSAVKGPGGFWFSLTGMDFQHADAGEVQGVGLSPDVDAGNLIVPLDTDYQSGTDPELERALTVVQAP